MAPHSSTFAWKIPWMEEPDGLQSMGSLRVRRLGDFTFMHWRKKWQPSPVFLPENPRDEGAWWAAVYRVAQSRTRLKRLSSSSSSSSNHFILNASHIAKLFFSPRESGSHETALPESVGVSQ